MKIKIISFSLFFIAVLLFPVGITLAQASPFGNRDMDAPIDIGGAYRLPGVFATDLSIIENDGKTLLGSFTAWNNEDDTIGGLQYNIEIFGKDGSLYEKNPIRKPFHLNPKEKRTINFSYHLPNLLAGDYVLRVQMDTNSGRLLGWSDTTLKIKNGTDSFVKITPKSIYLTNLKLEIEDPESGPNVSPDESFSLKASLKNEGEDTITFTPVLNVYDFDIAKGNGITFSLTPITLRSQESMLLDFPLKASKTPGVYAALLQVNDESDSKISSLGEYRWVVRGMAADVLPMRINRLSLDKNGQVVLRLDAVGAPDAETNVVANIKVQVTDSKGVAGEAEVLNVVLGQSVTETTARVTLKRNIVSDPTIVSTITDGTGTNVLAVSRITIDVSEHQLKPEKKVGVNVLLGIVLLFLMLLLIYLIMNRKTAVSLSTFSVFTIAIAAGFMLFTGVQVFSAGNNNGIEVWTSPLGFGQPEWPGGVVQLFINSPIHDAPAGTYNKNAVPLQYRLSYAVCQNRITHTRVVGRFDVNGGKHTTLTGNNSSNWEVVHNQLHDDGPLCQNGAGHCVQSKDFSGVLNLSNLSSSAQNTTLQLVAKWGQSGWTNEGLSPWDVPSATISPNDFSFDTTGWQVNHGAQASFVHAVNLWLNFAQPVCSTNSQCGTDGFTGGPFCTGNGVYKNYITYTCNFPGTTNSSCSSSTTAQLQNMCLNNQTCSNGSCVNNVPNQCQDGIDNDNDGATDYPNDFSCSSATDNDETNPKAECQDGIDNDGDNLIDYPQDPGCSSNQDNNEFNPFIACSSNSQCGTDGFTGSNFCTGNGVYKNYITYTCNNPGTSNASCSSSTSAQLQNMCLFNQTCSNGSCVAQNQCSDGIDNDNDGATDYPADFSCSSATDNDETNPKAQCQDGVDNDNDGLIDYPQDSGCSSKQDNDEFNAVITCSTNTQCGTDGFTGGPYCSLNGVYKNYITYTCNNPGTTSSYCSNSTSAQLQQTCSGNQTCSNGSCSATTTCTTHSYKSCSDNAVYWYNSCGTKEDLYQVCNNNMTCSNNACVAVQQQANLTAVKTVKNLSFGSASYTSSANAIPSDILSITITLQNTSNQAINNVTLTDSLPSTIFYNDNITVDSVATSGNITQGLNIGTLNANQTKTVIYQIQAASAQSFSFGTTTLTLPTTVTASNASTQSPSVTVFVTRSAIQGVTTIPTGFTNNLLANSFLLPLALALLAMWVLKSRALEKISFFGGAAKKYRNYVSGNRLVAKIEEIRNRESER